MSAPIENRELPAPQPEASEPKPAPQAPPQLVMLTTDDDGIGLCNLDGECS